MKHLVLLFFLLFGFSCFSQILVEPDIDNPNYNKLVRLNDSISKIKIEPDTVTKYKIKEIIDQENFYIIYAEGCANDGNLYQYRIKSEKVNCSESNQIKIGEEYQLDLRDFDNHNLRLHFRPGVAFNLVTHTGFGGYFDIVACLDEPLSFNEFNIALNLKGLCVESGYNEYN